LKLISPGRTLCPRDLDCKAHPDEKGIETAEEAGLLSAGGRIARPIPTKRELKLLESSGE